MFCMVCFELYLFVFIYFFVYFPVQFCLSVSVKLLAVKSRYQNDPDCVGWSIN